jgi:hypothetical protein
VVDVMKPLVDARSKTVGTREHRAWCSAAAAVVCWLCDLNQAYVVEHASAWDVGYRHAEARAGLCDAFSRQGCRSCFL